MKDNEAGLVARREKVFSGVPRCSDSVKVCRDSLVIKVSRLRFHSSSLGIQLCRCGVGGLWLDTDSCDVLLLL